jgi:tetratricopeptide (TPR) repeat protein
MLKRLVKWLKRFFNFAFGKKQTHSNIVGEHQEVETPPELTNADLEFLFTQLLEGVHQARGQAWAIKYLERVEHRISNERWIEWLLNFGERLLISPAPNIQIAERMVQLGELNIGTIGDLSYDIGIRLLTRNLGEPYQDSDELEASVEPDEQLAEEVGELDSQTITSASPSISKEKFTTLVWEYEEPKVETTPLPLIAPYEQDDEQYSEDETLSKASSEVVQWDESIQNLEPAVANTLDELLVRLEQSTNLVEQLASGLSVQTTTPHNKSLSTQFSNTLELAQAWFYQGLQQAKSGELSAALISYDKAIEINPICYEYWFNRGLTLFYLGNFSEAIKSYNRVIEIKPDFYKGWHNRGGALGELGLFEDAIASFNKAIEIKFDYHEAWSSLGWALLKLDRLSEAIASYDKALLMQPQDQENWYYRGMALAQWGRTNDAIASYDRALEIQPDFHLAWYGRGVELSHLGRLEDAIPSLQQAVEIYPEFYEAWYALGDALGKLGHTQEAIASLEQAAQINPDSQEIWIDKGVALGQLGRWGEAILSWEKALEIKSDLYLAWFNKAVALENMARREEAIASYKKALEIQPDFYLAWYNLGVALFYLERFEEAISAYDSALQIKLDYWEAWFARGSAAGNAANYDSHQVFVSAIAQANPALYQRGYEGKLASFEEGLRYVDKDIYPEGWGRLHLALGNAHYDQAKRHSTPVYYCEQAITEYEQALTTLTLQTFPELHLEVLQNLIKSLLCLGQTSQAQELHQYAKEVLRQILLEPTRSDENTKYQALKNIGFRQLAVDIAVQCGEIAEAVEIAEYGKNACLTWLLSGWKDEIISPNYSTIQQLLNPTTAIIYWHISPCTLRTFIIKYESPEPIPIFTPILNVGSSDELPLPEAVERLVAFEDWLEDWNQHYQEYGSFSDDTEHQSNHSWEVDMEQRLFHLKQILNISSIIQELEDITQLILIPHRDLYKIPLHALFNLSSHYEEDLPRESFNYIFTYLPSVQVGLSLQSQPLSQVETLPLLSVENPITTNYPLRKFAQFESEAVSQMFHSVKRLQGSKANKTQVENALSSGYNIFHFTGYITDNLNHPQASELLLAGEDKLTLEEISNKQLTNYKLVTLSASETSINRPQIMITEYVDLVSGFLTQGVPYVVSTLWNINSAASALVMIEFYKGLKQDKSPATALAEATQWLKELTAGDLKKWYEALLNELHQEGLGIRANLATELYRISKLPADTKIYNHPYHWAAFIVAGRF